MTGESRRRDKRAREARASREGPSFAIARRQEGQAKLWNSSRYHLAMDHATDTSAPGDFANATFERYGVKSRFFHLDGKVFVETDGPDGMLAPLAAESPRSRTILARTLIERDSDWGIVE